MTSTEHQLATSVALDAYPLSEPAPFEIIDAPEADIIQTIPSGGDLESVIEINTGVRDAVDEERPPTGDTSDAHAELADFIQTLLQKPLVVHALASRARTLMLKDFAYIKSIITPLHEDPQPSNKFSALTVQAAVHALLSTSPYISVFSSRLARQPVLAALATHPASDPGSLAFTYVLINSPEGEDFARKAAEIQAARMRDWFALRIAQAKPAYTNLTSAVHTAWKQTVEWAPSIAVGGGAIALYTTLDS